MGATAGLPAVCHQPRVLTRDRVGRLTESNTAARALRAMGFRVTGETPFPDDAGSPVLLLDLNGRKLQALLDECDASTRRPGGHISARFHGVRVVVKDEGEALHV